MTQPADNPFHLPAGDRRAWLKHTGAGLVGLSTVGMLPSSARAAARSGRALAAPAAVGANNPVLVEFSRRVGPGMTPSTTLGPYYLANMPVRSDITAGQTGLPVRLFYLVLDFATLSPIPGATVDIWQANSCGIYSGFASQGTLGQNWLRGIQSTDANGIAVFDSVFPGWYVGRTAHIHARVRRTAAATPLTTQFFFDDLLGYPGLQVNPLVYQYIAPYAQCGAPQTLNQNDPIYNAALSQISLLRNDGTFGLWAGLVIII
jgi:protocatechuate 3,4-dioxygenase beta subunit